MAALDPIYCRLSANLYLNMMARYFFNLHNDIEVIDEEGAEFPNVFAASAHAVKSARIMAGDAAVKGKLTLSHRIDVQDEARETVAIITFRDAVTIVD